MIDAGYLEGRFYYPDQAAMLRGQSAGQVAVLAERAAGEAAVTDAVINAFASCRTPSGGTGSSSSGASSWRASNAQRLVCRFATHNARSDGRVGGRRASSTASMPPSPTRWHVPASSRRIEQSRERCAAVRRSVSASHASCVDPASPDAGAIAGWLSSLTRACGPPSLCIFSRRH